MVNLGSVAKMAGMDAAMDSEGIGEPIVAEMEKPEAVEGTAAMPELLSSLQQQQVQSQSQQLAVLADSAELAERPAKEEGAVSDWEGASRTLHREHRELTANRATEVATQ